MQDVLKVTYAADGVRCHTQVFTHMPVQQRLCLDSWTAVFGWRGLSQPESSGLVSQSFTMLILCDVGFPQFLTKHIAYFDFMLSIISARCTDLKKGNEANNLLLMALLQLLVMEKLDVLIFSRHFIARELLFRCLVSTRKGQRISSCVCSC